MKRMLVIALLVLVASTTAAAGIIVYTHPASFSATFEARAVADPTVEACPALGRGGQTLEGRYHGTMTVGGEEYGIHFVLEALVDRTAGAGSAEGRWTISDPRTENVVGRGELIATVTADPPTEVNPPDPDLELQGLLIGTVSPPDPDMPAQRLLGNFAATLGDGATFPHLKGAVGDPTVGDPSGLESNPAVLLPAVKC